MASHDLSFVIASKNISDRMYCLCVSFIQSCGPRKLQIVKFGPIIEMDHNENAVRVRPFKILKSLLTRYSLTNIKSDSCVAPGQPADQL